MVCSHEIAASTAQLVAASKVGARCAVPQSMLWGSQWCTRSSVGIVVPHEHGPPLGPGR